MYRSAVMCILYLLYFCESDVNVHIDVMTAQTGVSRFSQIYSHWAYVATHSSQVIFRLMTWIAVRHHLQISVLQSRISSVCSFTGITVSACHTIGNCVLYWRNNEVITWNLLKHWTVQIGFYWIFSWHLEDYWLGTREAIRPVKLLFQRCRKVC